MGMFKVTRNRVVTVDRNKMCSAKNGIEMDDGHLTVALGIQIGVDHPHSDIRVRLVPDDGKPGDKCARVCDVRFLQRHECEDSCCMQAAKPRLFSILLNKDAVIARCTAPPGTNRPDPLAVHPTNARLVTGRKKGGNSGRKDFDLARVQGTVVQWYIMQWNVAVGIFLRKEESTNHVGEAGDLQECAECVWAIGVLPH